MTRFQSLEFNEPTEHSASEFQNSSDAPRDEEHYNVLAYEQFQKARFEQALRYYSRALEFNPNYELAWVGQVRMLIELGEFHEAGIWADKALDIFRDQAELLAAKAVVYVRMGNRKKALEFSDAAINHPTPTTYVWLVRGEVMLATRARNGDYCLEKARSIAGNDWFNHLLIARIYYFHRQYAKALGYARKAMELQATSAFVWQVLGNCQEMLSQRREAKISYTQALLIDPDFHGARTALNSMHYAGWFSRLFPSFFRKHR
jgi:tetratricopeptide (TPR) repeat protein